MTTVELVGAPASGEYWQGPTVLNLLRGIEGVGVLADSIGATVTGADRVVTLPAFGAQAWNAAHTILKAQSYAGGDLTHDVGSTYPRVDLGVWDDSDATCKIVKGTPTEEVGDVAEAPEPDITQDQHIIYRVRIPASASFIAAADVKPRAVNVKRRWITVYSDTSESTTTSTSATPLKAVTGLNILPGQFIRIRGEYRKTATAAQAVGLGLTLNSTVQVTAVASSNAIAYSSGTQQAEAGEFEVLICPRNANYPACIYAYCGTRVSGSGSPAVARAAVAAAMAATLVTVDITGITITGINGTSNNNLALSNLTIETMTP